MAPPPDSHLLFSISKYLLNKASSVTLYSTSVIDFGGQEDRCAFWTASRKFYIRKNWFN